MTVQRNEPVQLKCSADGIPPPVIEWYRDGEFIIGSSSSASSSSSAAATSRILLPDGALFFLRVAHGRKENDSGVYWCLARNSHGVARSRNATLTVARKSYIFFQFFYPQHHMLRIRLLRTRLIMSSTAWCIVASCERWQSRTRNPNLP